MSQRHHLVLIVALILGASLVAVPGCGDSGGGGDDTSATGDDTSATGDDTSATGDDTSATGDDTGGTEGDAEVTTGDATAADLDAAGGSDDDAAAGDLDAGPQPDEDVEDQDLAPDAEPDTAGGGDTSGPADAVDPVDPIDLPDALVAAACQSLCGGLEAEACPFGPLGADLEACVGTCEALVAADGHWLANLTCYEQVCDAALCQLEGDPLPPDAGCATACDVLDQCDQLATVDLPEDEPEVCAASCTGGVIADPINLPIALACIVDALDPTCDGDALLACFGEAPPDGDFCVAVCGSFFDAANDQYCEPGTWVAQNWSLGECAAACDGWESDVLMSLRFWGCMLVNGCGEPGVCLEPPTEEDPGCVSVCDGMFELCETFGGIQDAEQCAPLCTGILHGIGVPADADAGQCVADAGQCPADDDAKSDLFFGCAVPTPEVCGSLCEAVVPCAGDDFTMDDCLGFCAFGGWGSVDDLEVIGACVEPLSVEQCPQIIGCFQPPAAPADPICEPMCVKADEVCGTTDATVCQESCNGNVDAGIGYLAEAICLLAAACDAQLACFGLGLAPVSAECVAACDGHESTCGGYSDGCERACQGAEVGLGVSGDASGATCIVSALGDDCAVESAISACAP